MQPESSDGFASVGTILPEERAAQLPGGSFRFCGIFSDRELAKGTPADVGQDGAAHDETGNGEGGEQTDPEADAAERNEE